MRDMPTILVVDDEPAINDIIRLVLEEEGYKVITAANGRQALELAASARPDLLLCDVMMPLMDGRSVCRAINRDPELRGIPVVLMSAVPDMLSRADCNYAAFIRKPFDIELVVRTVEKVLAAQDGRDQAAS